MNFQTLNTQRKLILIAAAIGVISIFLPWITVSIFGQSNSANGFRDTGIVVFLAFVAAGVVSVMGDQTSKLDKKMWIIALGAGAVALVFTLISFGTFSGGGGWGLVEAGYGFGIWIALIASIGILAFAWMHKNPEDNIADNLKSFSK